MGIWSEFKDFAAKGNVVDMGVGIVIGAAFTSIVTSFVNDIVNPVIGLFTGGIDFSDMFITLDGSQYASLEDATAAGAPIISYGLFMNAVISFLIVAFVLFIIVRNVNRLKKRVAQEEEAAAPPAPSKEETLLTEIRDLLRAQANARPSVGP